MSKELTLIIFSKDRALQLDSLLRSIKRNYLPIPADIVILYNASTNEFSQGYNKLIKSSIIDGINWIEEHSFTEDLRNTVDKLNENSFVQFMTDDDILFRKFDATILNNFSDNNLALSLRVDRDYPRFSPPKFKTVKDTLSWNWYPLFTKRSGNFWYYPFSVDGNIFHTSDIKKMLNLITFRAPNSFEGEMHQYKRKFLNRRTMLATPQAVLFNNPLNSVQLEGETWNAGLSVEEMNREFLAGKTIDNNKLYSSKPDEVHFIVEIELKE